MRGRQAFQLTIDRAAIGVVIGGGIFPPAQQPFPLASPYLSEKFPVIKPDIAKAKALLKQAGMETVEATLTFANNTIERSEEHTSELQSLMRISYAVFCLKKKNKTQTHTYNE